MFTLSSTPIDSLKLRQGLVNSTAGACVTFEGIVRNHNDGKNVTNLEYDAYSDLCDAEAQKIFEEAASRFSIFKAACVHRTGKLVIGDIAVWVGVSASHRDDAFKACRFIIDEIKTRLPIWKKEFYPGHESGWINCENATQSTKAYGHRN